MTVVLEAPATRPPVPAARLAGGRVSLRIERRTAIVAGVLVLTIVVAGGCALCVGDYVIPVPDVVKTLLGHGTSSTDFIVNTLRLPRIVAAVLIGAALGVSGGVFQGVSHNPLGSPDIIGFTTGASFGAVVEILVVHGGPLEISAGAVIGGVATALVVYLLALRKGMHGYRLILVGIGVSAIFDALITFLLIHASLTDAESATVWLIGSLNGISWSAVGPAAAVLAILVPATVIVGRALPMLSMGDDAAKALGVRVEGSRLALLFLGVGCCAVAVAASGPIAFVALVAPQVAKRLTCTAGAGLVTAGLMGALLLVVSDFAAQHAIPSVELPVGVATGAVGGCYLAWLLSREWRAGRG